MTNRTRNFNMETPESIVIFRGQKVTTTIEKRRVLRGGAAVKLPRMKIALFAALVFATPALSQPVNPASDAKPADPGEWHSLFNGRDLSGWTVKINKHPIGENFADTFRVEDGVIKVSYDRYGKFDEQFGHLYSNQAYGSYVLQLEYKITGAAVADSPPWAKLNSGVMIHSQSPMTMGLNQAWPASMEVQFLAVGTTAGRQTGNVCTPGTNLEMKGKLLTDHIIDSTSKLYPLD